MMNILILLISGVTLALMTSDPRASAAPSVASAWQQQEQLSSAHDVTSKTQVEREQV
ncbi:ABZJ_00068 family colistin stress protein [Acinetobacter bouvetii]|uniref:Secreted protein n=1 Tax=Acinetobacter bouvetii TaxID=202951 RepID=A0A811GEG9_9GAMM|nr:hypothetical protein [Acinetobacter bouvetii]CAB1206625.1 hypothetical protein SFB21_0041 [Acinetobacter bouvetii]